MVLNILINDSFGRLQYVKEIAEYKGQVPRLGEVVYYNQDLGATIDVVEWDLDEGSVLLIGTVQHI